MRKLLSSFPHHHPERVMVMPCQWRVPHHPLAPHSRRELTDFCVTLKETFFFFFTKDNISLKVIFKREVKMNMCHVNSGGFPHWQGQLPQTLVLNVDIS